MILEFTKMHGCGNDYIYVDGFKQHINNPFETAVCLSRRHFSIGSDGLIIVCPSDVADAKMKMYNADGSEGKMCGNGIRCVAKFVHDNKISSKNPLKIETLSGIKTVKLNFENDEVTGATVDMGKPVFEPDKIPAIVNYCEPVINKEFTFGDNVYRLTLVNMGNPHCVIFVSDDFELWNFNIEKYGSEIENDKMFPEKVNVEFVKVIDKNKLEMRVWERGSGETLACGTGACASVAAAVKNNYCNMGDDVTVKLKGGELVINYTGEGIKMTGEAVTSFHGRVEV